MENLKKTIYALLVLMFTLASCEKENGPEIGGVLITKGYADLGLSVKWASCNVGATTPEGYGNYYNFDAAQAYSLPTKAQMQELVDNCTWVGARLYRVYGVKVTGPNGNSIFMPSAGYFYDRVSHNYGSSGYYFSISPYPDCDNNAYDLHFHYNGDRHIHSYKAPYEFPVRTVSEY